MNTEQLKVALWQNACLNFCKLFCKLLKDKPQGFNNELGLFQDRLVFGASLFLGVTNKSSKKQKKQQF